MRCCDVLLSFPSLLLAFIFVAGLGRNTFNAVLALGIVYVPMLTRLTRSLTLVEKNKVYVAACDSLGYSDLRIMYRHILPNCISTILVQITLDIAYAILDMASLSFLGLGTQPPQADWGSMLDEGRAVLLMNPPALPHPRSGHRGSGGRLNISATASTSIWTSPRPPCPASASTSANT